VSEILRLKTNGLAACGLPVANNESSEVFDIIKPGRRVNVKLKVTGSKMSITSDDSDSLFACFYATPIECIADRLTVNS